MTEYTGKGEKLKARQFRELCRYYEAEKAWLRRLHEQIETEGETIHLKNRCLFLQENIGKVDTGIHRISDRYGAEAGRIIRRKYVERTDIRDLAKETGLSARTLQRKMAVWLDEVDL